MGIELRTPNQPLGRGGVVGSLEVYQAEEVGGVGVCRVDLDDALEIVPGRLDLAQVVVQEAADVQCAGLVRIRFENLRQYVQGEPFVTFVLAVERCDGQIDACIEPIRCRIDYRLEFRHGLPRSRTAP